jgi:hypothetical protein
MTIIAAILTALISALIIAAIVKIKGSIRADQIAEIVTLVGKQVKAAEQTITAKGGGAEKKAAVIDAVKTAFGSISAKLAPFVDAAIEAEVYDIKKDKS